MILNVAISVYIDIKIAFMIIQNILMQIKVALHCDQRWFQEAFNLNFPVFQAILYLFIFSYIYFYIYYYSYSSYIYYYILYLVIFYFFLNKIFVM